MVILFQTPILFRMVRAHSSTKVWESSTFPLALPWDFVEVFPPKGSKKIFLLNIFLDLTNL